MTDLAALTERRKRLIAAGYAPIPANGKAVRLAGWSSLQATEADIEAWGRDRPSDTNTGLLTARARPSTSTCWTPPWPPSCTASSSA
jgi:hypothetical protein